MPQPRIRHATPADLDGLVALEEATFDCDRISRRQWRHHLASGRATVLVVGPRPRLDAAAMVLYRKHSPNARLYSIAVGAWARGHGIGRSLLAAIEADARRHGCATLHLEVRVDNLVAIRVYERRGYVQRRRLPGFYEDGADGWSYQRALRGDGTGEPRAGA